MTMTRVLASADPARALAANQPGSFGMALFQIGTRDLAGLGRELLDSARTLPRPPSQRAWDFLSFALAVFGADRFVLRDATADGWTRMMALEVEVADPAPWNGEAERLAAALRFLTGDIWHLRFLAGGMGVPEFQPRFTDRDCACLFSGGLDSLIGAAGLLTGGRRPLLVSQASPKEKSYQNYLAERLGLAEQHFRARASERFRPPYEPSSRARSILFIAYGVLAASALAGRDDQPSELFIPENGLISINPPLTRRRIGSLSTRTTHPHFIASLQACLAQVGLHVALHNPYGLKTKGEMLRECRHEVARRYADRSYSCGKGKRLNRHCGRCVPCLIRRAAFRAAGMADATAYHVADLAAGGPNDDVFAARMGVVQLGTRDMARWTAEAGPLPDDPARRAAYVDAVGRGLGELRNFLGGVVWP